MGEKETEIGFSVENVASTAKVVTREREREGERQKEKEREGRGVEYVELVSVSPDLYKQGVNRCRPGQLRTRGSLQMEEHQSPQLQQEGRRRNPARGGNKQGYTKRGKDTASSRQKKK